MEIGYDGKGQLISIIDSGIDPEHPDFKGISDNNSARIKSKADFDSKIAELKKLNINIPGKYYNQKVVYGYNYKDGMSKSSKDREHSIKEELSKGSTFMHGTHVAGIAAANGKLKGVAPEAQLLVMRVIPESEISMFIPDEVYIKAIEDSVILGADAINLSLSEPSVSKKRLVKGLSAAIEKASNMGCVVNIAAGNDSYFGYGVTKPKADLPDYGLIGTPAVHDHSLSVASVNNKVKYLKTIFLNDTKRNGAYLVSSSVKPEYNTPINYEYLNFGETNDFKNKKLDGKYALISRGKMKFSDMAKLAKDSKAKGVILIFNTNDDEPFLAGNIDFAQIPVVAVGNLTGKEMIDNKQTVILTADPKSFNISNPSKMSEFSSWGLGVEEDFKPEITAPGGHVYSTVNDGEYSDLAGTSMATPQVTGASAIVSQRVKREFPQISGINRNRMIKNLLMSTAIPKKESDEETFVSPRNQGAGLMDVDGAVKTNVIVVNKDTLESKINKKDQKGPFTLDIRVINLGDEIQTFSLNTTVQTDLVKDGFMQLKPRLLEKISGGIIKLNPRETKDITIKVDAHKYEKELTSKMKNGYFIEGFVRLKNDKQSIGLPYISFHGN